MLITKIHKYHWFIKLLNKLIIPPIKFHFQPVIVIEIILQFLVTSLRIPLLIKIIDILILLLLKKNQLMKSTFI
jgi:type IV secretory pathway TrbL component